MRRPREDGSDGDDLMSGLALGVSAGRVEMANAKFVLLIRRSELQDPKWGAVLRF